MNSVYLDMYNWIAGTYSGWLSVCKSPIESSTVLGVIRKDGAWQGNYVNRLFDLNWRSCWFLLFCGLMDSYYVATPLVQTSQVLLAFMCFDWPWLHVLLHSMLRLTVSGGSKDAADLFYNCGFQAKATFQAWNLGAFDTQNISRTS